MKKLTVILFEDLYEYEKYANSVCNKFVVLSDESEFLGTWWIDHNEEEAYSAISDAVNHFIENTDKKEIIFGVGNKDYDSVIPKINIRNCVVEAVNCKKL